MKRLPSLTLGFLAALAACAGTDEPGGGYRTDAEGYVLPQACRAAPESVPARVVRISRASVQIGALGQNANAYYRPSTNEIAIASDVLGWRYADTLRHEQFHAYCQASRDPCCTGHFQPMGDK